MTAIEILFIVFVVVFVIERLTGIYFGFKGLKRVLTEDDFNKGLLNATDQVHQLNIRLMTYQDEYKKLYDEYMRIAKLNKELTEKNETESFVPDENPTNTKKKPNRPRKKKNESGEKNS